MIFERKEPDVRMNGKEYLQYLHLKEKQRKEKAKRVNEHMRKNALVYVTALIVVGVLFIIFMMYDYYTYQPPIPSPWTWEKVGKFLAITAGIGWILHGVGFTIIGKLG